MSMSVLPLRDAALFGEGGMSLAKWVSRSGVKQTTGLRGGRSWDCVGIALRWVVSTDYPPSVGVVESIYIPTTFDHILLAEGVAIT
jgi:hypothetical protein